MNNGAFKQKKVYFSQVSNFALRDPTISLKAKGLYALIQSYITIENFTLYKNTLKKQCSEKELAFQSAWNELKKAGYLVQTKLNNGNGKFTYEYDLLDSADINHTPYNQGMDNPLYGDNGVYNNTDFNAALENKDLKYNRKHKDGTLTDYQAKTVADMANIENIRKRKEV